MITSILNSLINSSFINQYTETFQRSPFKVLQQIKKMSNNKFEIENRSICIKEFQQNINQIQKKLGLKQRFNLDSLLKTYRNTDFNLFVTELLFSNIKHRQKIESIRIKSLESLKRELVDYDSFNLLYTIYKKIFFGTQSVSFQRMETIEGKKTFKTILTSLKKTIIVPKIRKTKKSKIVSTQPYYVNVDTKQILKNCLIQAQLTMEKSLTQKLQNILQQKKKWMGPRIWKIVQENQWAIDQIQMLINLIQISYKTLDNFKSEPKQLKKHVQKMVLNLRTLINTFASPCQTDILGSQMKELYSQFESMDKMQDFDFEFQNIQQIEDRLIKEKQKQSQLFCEDHSSFWL